MTRVSRKSEGTCPTCGKTFTYYPSAYEGGVKVHCSRACRKASVRVDTTCPRCGKAFWYYKSWPRKYCSRECSGAANIVTNLGVQVLPDAFCEVCGQKITGQRWAGQRFCSLMCFGVHLSQTRAGIPRPELRGEQPQRQRRVAVICPQCGKTFQVKQSQSDRRRFCSKTCVSRWWSENGINSGPDSPTWRGGSTGYYGPNWLTQRRNARRRDNYTCQRCGVTETELGRQLDVHHKTPFRDFGIERYREANGLANLISFCNRCHLLTEWQDHRHSA